MICKIDVEHVSKQVDAFFSDTSRPAEQTREGLERLKEEIDGKLQMLDEDEGF